MPVRRAWLRDRKVLAELVDLCGLSEREISRQAQLAPATVNHLLTGRRQSCSEATAHAIAGVIGVPTIRLFLL